MLCLYVIDERSKTNITEFVYPPPPCDVWLTLAQYVSWLPCFHISPVLLN